MKIILPTARKKNLFKYDTVIENRNNKFLVTNVYETLLSYETYLYKSCLWVNCDTMKTLPHDKIVTDMFSDVGRGGFSCFN